MPTVTICGLDTFGLNIGLELATREICSGVKRILQAPGRAERKGPRDLRRGEAPFCE